jgi:hypothetical protein
MTTLDNAPTDTSFIHKFHAEATFKVKESKDNYHYAYVTYDRNKLKGFHIKNLARYNIQAWATTPITQNGIVDMRLFTGKDDSIL